MTFEKIKQFIEWYDPALLERAKLLERGWTVCAESLKVSCSQRRDGSPGDVTQLGTLPIHAPAHVHHTRACAAED